MKIRDFRQNELKEIKDIVNRLHPKWFDKKALRNIPIDMRLQKCFVAEKNGKVVGFISVYSKDGEAEIGWIGVDPDWRKKGIGKKLFKKVEKELKKLRVKILRVKTVGRTSPRYEPYYETVAFYKACGFSIEKRSKTKKEKGYKYKMYTFKKCF